MTERTEPDFFTVNELAVWLKVNPMTVRRMAKRGELAAYSVGRAIRFRRSDVEDFLRRCRLKAGDEANG